MNLHEISISRLAYRILFNVLEVLEYDVDAFTKETGISHDFSSNFDEKVSAEQYYRAWNRAAELPQEPLIGLVAGAHSHPANLGALGFAMMNCATTGEAFHLFFRFQHMDNRSIIAEVEEKGDDMVVRLESPIYQPDFIAVWMETIAAGYGRMFHHLTNFRLVDKYNYRAAHFVHKPRGPIEHYEKILRCPVFFEQDEYRFVFDRRVFQEKVHQADEDLRDTLLAKINQAWTEPADSAQQPISSLPHDSQLSEPSEDEFERSIRQQIKQHLSKGAVDMEVIAAQLKISASTLKRRLNEAGWNYRELVQDLRYQVAQQLLQADALSHTEIAFMLGFSSGSSFSRAFRQWSGNSPSEYFKNQAGS